MPFERLAIDVPKQCDVEGTRRILRVSWDEGWGIAERAVASGLLRLGIAAPAQTAQVILAEIGTDLSRFPTAGHLASWAGTCPGNNQSAGKHHSGRTRHGSQWPRRSSIDRQRRLIARLEALGHKVTLEPAAWTSQPEAPAQ